MGGRMILFAIVCFALYWAWQYYKNRPKKECKDDKGGPVDYTKGAVSPDKGPSKVDELIAEFNKKIADIESKSIEEIKRSEDLLKYYKDELEKLNNLKNK